MKKEKTKSAGQTAMLAALLWAAAAFAFAAIRRLGWETNDDTFVIADINEYGSNFNVVVYKQLTALLHRIYLIVPGIEWWTLLNICMVLGCIAAVSYLLYRVLNRAQGFFFSLIVAFFIMRTGLWTMNYTRTAALGAVGGMALILFAVFAGGRDVSLKERGLCYCLGLAFTQLSFAMRDMAALPQIFLFGLCSLLLLAEKVRSELFSQPKTFFLRMAALAAVLVFTALNLGLSRVLLTPQEKEYIRFYEGQSLARDYHTSYDYDLDRLAAAGISSNDVNMLTGLCNADQTVFTAETYETLQTASLKQPFAKNELEEGMRSLWQMEQNNILYILALVIGLVLIGWPGALAPCLAQILAACSLLGYLVVKGRLVPRVTDIIVVGTGLSVLLFLLLSQKEYFQRYRLQLPEGNDAGTIAQALKGRSFRLLFAGRSTKGECELYLSGREPNYEKLGKSGHVWCLPYRALAALLLLAWLFCVSATQIPALPRGKTSQETEIENRQELFAYLMQYPEEAFFFKTTGTQKFFFGQRIKQENYFEMGDWTTYSTHTLQRYEKWGIDTPFRSFLEKDNVYAQYDSRVLRFFHEHYSPDISASRYLHIVLSNSDYFEVVQYLAPVRVEEIPAENIVPAALTFTPDNRGWEMEWSVTATAENADWEKLYCTLTLNGAQKTYMLTRNEDGTYGGMFYNMPQDMGSEERAEAATTAVCFHR